MQNAMYSALFGALTNEHRLNSIANNLANVNTTGYKRDMLAFKDSMALFAHDQIMEPVQNLRATPMFPEPQHIARPRMAIAVTDFQQGGMRVTGAPFDIAIAGDGFFKVQTPDGSDFYTRNGHFRLTPEGTLITEQGFSVLGDGGDVLTIPAGYRNVTISEDGRIFADDALIGQIAMVNVDMPGNLQKLGHNLYKPREGAEVNEIDVDGAFMAQGFLESANVDPVYEMVNMIEAQRQFEAYSKIMQTSDAIDKEAINKIGRGR